MKNIRIILIVFTILLCNISIYALTYNESITRTNNYLDNYFSDVYKPYIINNAPFKFDTNGIDKDNAFTGGGMLNKREYELSLKGGYTYLLDGNEYWTMTGDGASMHYVMDITNNDGLSLINNTSGANLKVTEYLKKYTKVSGKGTYNNPWKIELIGTKVAFDVNGGNNLQTNNKIVHYMTSYGDMPEPVRDNYSFNGWYTQKTGGALVDSTTICNTMDNHTLYAHWKSKTFDCTYTGYFVTSASAVDKCINRDYTSCGALTGNYVAESKDFTIYFLSDGDLTINSTSSNLDLWLLGGGGGGGNDFSWGPNGCAACQRGICCNEFVRFAGTGGGGGGNVNFIKDTSLTLESTYHVTIGNGGNVSEKGGTSMISNAEFSISASGGDSTSSQNGGAGGDIENTTTIEENGNGGHSGYPQSGGNGTIKAKNGAGGNPEFGDSTIYRGGGGGGGAGGSNYGYTEAGGHQETGIQSKSNTAGGGAGGYRDNNNVGHDAEPGKNYYGGGGGGRGDREKSGASGGCGIVAIRNAR